MNRRSHVGILLAFGVALALAVPGQARAGDTLTVTTRPAGSGAVHVSWTSEVDGALVTSARVFRSDLGYASSALGGAGQTELDIAALASDYGITDVGLRNGVPYYYSVFFRALYVDTYEERWIGPVTASFRPSVSPVNDEPSVEAGDHYVELSWGDPDSDLGYKTTRVLRSTFGFASAPAVSPQQSLAYVGTAGTFTDRTVANERQYFYTLFVEGSDGVFSEPVTATATPTEYEWMDGDPDGELPLLAKQGRVYHGDSSAQYPTFDYSTAFRVTLSAGQVISAWIPMGYNATTGRPAVSTAREVVLFGPRATFSPGTTPVARATGRAFPYFGDTMTYPAGSLGYGYPPVLAYRVPAGAGGTYYLAVRRKSPASTANQEYGLYWSKASGTGSFKIGLTKTWIWTHPQVRNLRQLCVTGRVSPAAVAAGATRVGDYRNEDTSVAIQKLYAGKWTTIGWTLLKDDGTFRVNTRISRSGPALVWRLYMPAFGGCKSAVTTARTTR